jgi:hypothetical protein
LPQDFDWDFTLKNRGRTRRSVLCRLTRLLRTGYCDIRTTMNVYGDVVTNEMQEAHSKVVQMALPKPN